MEEDECGQLRILVQQLRAKVLDHEHRSKCLTSRWINDDNFLSMFLRIKEYDLERAFVAVQKYYRHYEAFPDIHCKIGPSSNSKPLYDEKLFVILEQKCKMGTTVVIIRIKAWDTSKFDVLAVRQSNLFIAQELIRKKEFQTLSFTFILDLRGFSFGHLRQFKPHDLRYLMAASQDGIPLRIAGVHLINYPAIFLGLYYIGYGFMKQKLRSRIHFHRNPESLHKFIDKEALPECLGGSRSLYEVADRDCIQNVIDKLGENDMRYADYYF